VRADLTGRPYHDAIRILRRREELSLESRVDELILGVRKQMHRMGRAAGNGRGATSEHLLALSSAIVRGAVRGAHLFGRDRLVHV
jgi:hypothetical protein